MRLFMIGYSLLSPESKKREKEIGETIKKVTGWWWHHLPNVWLVASRDDKLDSDNIYESISGVFTIEGDITDNIFVARLVPGENAGFLPKKAWDWIAKVEKSETAAES